MSDYRTKCLRNKEEECHECGTTVDIEVHHIDEDRFNNALKNLLPLCHDCHMKVHNGHPGFEHLTKQLGSMDGDAIWGEVTDEDVFQAFEEAGLE